MTLYRVIFVAEKERFELSNAFTRYTISSRAPSTKLGDFSMPVNMRYITTNGKTCQLFFCVLTGFMNAERFSHTVFRADREACRKRERPLVFARKQNRNCIDLTGGKRYIVLRLTGKR